MAKLVIEGWIEVSLVYVVIGFFPLFLSRNFRVLFPIFLMRLESHLSSKAFIGFHYNLPPVLALTLSRNIRYNTLTGEILESFHKPTKIDFMWTVGG
ncbi:hypothetical protein V6N13_029308 [Hibiscus sabdariffa]|uniref:Uncharacterized protein n=2 Tax=Hibiscus sabdariffa TaxID=183260 RepID=A0ABR2TB89_9ROSI